MIRTRLTLWNTAVFALALTLIGAVLYISIRSIMFRDADDDLTVRAADMQRMWATDLHMPGGPDGPRGRGGPGGPGAAGGLTMFIGPGPTGLATKGTEQIGLPWPLVAILGGVDGKGPNRVFRGGRGGPFGNRDLPESVLSTLDMDPIQAKRLAFSLRLSRPRFFETLTDEHRPEFDQPLDPDALSAAFTGEKRFTYRVIEGHRVRILSVPLRRSGKVAGAVQLASNLDEIDAVVDRVGLVLLAMLPLALIGTSLLGVWLTNRALQPVRDITRAAEQMEATNLSGRLPVQGRDEFAILSQRFNSMLDRIEGSFNRLGEAYEAQRRFIADASHELKTPLTTVKGRVGVALRGSHSPERYGEHLRSIGRAADSMSNIIQDLLLLARSDEAKLSLRREPYPLREIAHEAVMAATAAQPRPVQIDVPEEVQVAVDASLFTRALMNLLGNAIRHTSAEKEVKLIGRATGEEVIIEIVDQGEGIPADHLPLIFDRFHRVDPSRDRASGGTGLGLSIVRSIVEAHGGTVTISSIFGEGTNVTIRMPNAA